MPKKRYRDPSILSILLLGFTLLFPTACGTLEVGVERTATPDQAATATVAALATENARLSAQATMLASTPTSTPLPATPTPTPGPGTVTGRVCYPGERIPAMTAYFQNINTNQVIEMAVGENQPSYSITCRPESTLPMSGCPISQWVDCTPSLCYVAWGQTALITHQPHFR